MRQFLTSLVSYGKVTTTEARAKSLKREIERLISRSKDLSLVTRRKALALFTQKSAAQKFLEQIVPQFSQRVGGYVRVIKLAHRRGDRAPQARVEFVEEIKPRRQEVGVPTKASGEKAKPAKKAPKKAAAKLSGAKSQPKADAPLGHTSGGKVTRNVKKREEKRG